MHKFFIGPMSKQIVDMILEEDHNLFAFIPSRRQVEYNGGYVNNWTTEDFSKYVKSKNSKFLICRDHAGPNQGSEKDDGFLSLQHDALYFDMIHVDPWKYTKDIEIAAELTANYIEFVLKLNDKINFEIATEESIFPFENITLKEYVDKVSKLLGKKFNKITHLVIQSGTKLRENKQIGEYSKERLIENLKVAKDFNLLSKEHNGDYINSDIIKEKFNLGLDCINIAPEFGYIQTSVILEHLNETQIDIFFKLCYESGKWKSWTDENFDFSKKKKDLIKICGHYLFNHPIFLDKVYESKFESIINNSIKGKLFSLKTILGV